MAIRLGDEAPDFQADTTEGPISFHEWLGDSWGILFSHPKDFTPVCTTELGAFAKRKAEFDQRNAKILGLSVDSVESHHQWKGDIAETQGTALNYPLIGDENRTGIVPSYPYRLDLLPGLETCIGQIRGDVGRGGFVGHIVG